MPKAVRKCYSETAVEMALKEVNAGTTIRAASALFGIPRSTLFEKATNMQPIKTKMGPSTILTSEEENLFVDWIFESSKNGFPVNKERILDSVKLFVKDLKRETPFTNDRPSRHWFEAFRRRHPEIGERIIENSKQIRIAATEETLKNWFTNISSKLMKKNLLKIDSSRIYNCDECGIRLSPTEDKVIVRKSGKFVNKIVNPNEKESLTSLFTINAGGTLLPPLIIYWYKRIPNIVAQNVPENWNFDISMNGWITPEIFYKYIKNVFYPWLKSNEIQFPVVLYIDANSPHFTLPLSKFCKQVEIELIAFLPNLSLILQPLNFAVFQPMENVWRKAVKEWKSGNKETRMKIENFAPLLKNSIDSLNIDEKIKQGFKICGLFPFSMDAIDFHSIPKEIKTRKSFNHDRNLYFVDSEFIRHLKFLENQLPDDLIASFKESQVSGRWIGDIRNEGLYNYWLQIKNLAGNDGNCNVNADEKDEQNKDNEIDDHFMDASHDHREVDVEINDPVQSILNQGNAFY